MLSALFACGCKSQAHNMDAIRAYYRYDFTTAREALRSDANEQNDEQTILDNVRLGMASLADGDLHESETALNRSFELLSTAGLNKDRTAAAVFDHEGVRIWKGEPFEQALTFTYVATLYALLGDWENVRAAAANSLFRLTDFGADQSAEKLTRNAAKDPEYLSKYTAVDTNFAFGFLLQAVGSSLSGAPGSNDLLDAAVTINANLEEIASTLRSGQYNTLLIVDYGKGPTKIAYGPDEALVRFQPQDRALGEIMVSSDGHELSRQPPVCDVNAMAVDHRWNNLEDVRKAKSAIGDILLMGGAITTGYGANRNDGGTALVGLGAMALGLLTKAGARGDTRYCEFMPAAIYLIPLWLAGPCDVTVSIQSDPTAKMVISDVRPGDARKPRAIYLRLLGQAAPVQPRWLTKPTPIYSNDFTGPPPNGDFPWIIGGRDVSTPSRDVNDSYQSVGHLQGFTLDDLRRMYSAEGILMGSGMENAPRADRNPSYRHILEGGTGLFTPFPYSMGYKRLMFKPHPPYQPHSQEVWNLAEQMRVNTTEQSQPDAQENLE